MTTPSTNATWNPERVAQLRAFIGAGMTCSQIAAEIGVTRNAVIGKIHRLGLGPGRPAAALGRPCPPRTRRPRLPSQRQMLRLITADAPHACDGVVSEAATYYELDPDSGWVQLREPKLPELIAQKQRAAITPDALLAAIPAGGGRGPRYLYSARRNPLPRLLEGPGAVHGDPEVKRLQEALRARFPGELPADSDLPRM